MFIKFEDLNIRFAIDDTNFILLNLVYERFLRSIPNHSHSNNSYEIHYIPYGYGTALIDGVTYDIIPNTLYITGPKVEHKQEPFAGDPMVEYCIYLKMESSKNKKSTATSAVDLFKNTHFWYGQDTQTILPLLQQLFTELDGKSTGYETQVKTLLMQCIIKIICNYEADGCKRQQDLPRFLAQPNLYDKKYILLEECFLYEYQSLTLEKLAKRLGLGIRQTERLLKEHYGETFLQKRTEAKMSAAVLLLKDPTKSISTISTELGYSTLEHFSNAFKRYYGKSAREYRKSL